eukprot:3504762-Pleurochrysis_carterae.AAC.2
MVATTNPKDCAGRRAKVPAQAKMRQIEDARCDGAEWNAMGNHTAVQAAAAILGELRTTLGDKKEESKGV